jgi:ribosomal-protein-alanine N-acetyltransferase
MSLLASDESIETERLLLRRITRDDLPFYARIHADPDVARFLAHGNPRSVEETNGWMDALLGSYDALQLGQVAITRKSDGALVGRCGVSYLQTEVDDQADGTRLCYYYPTLAPSGAKVIVEQELGYTLDRAEWGHGYASEAVAGMWKYLSTKRPEPRVVSLIHPDNARSVRLARTFGVTLVDRVTSWGRPFDRYAWPAGKSPSIDR